MNPAFLVRFRPLGPWRIGPETGARDRVDFVLHSDALYSAVTHAMARLGRLEEWLAATASAGEPPAARPPAPFPTAGALRLARAPTPKTLWPPRPSPKVRWRNARSVPLSVVRDRVSKHPLSDNRCSLDGASG